TMPQVERLFQRLRTSPPDRIAGMPVDTINRLDGVKLIGRDASWLLFRRSGTEPIVRVYAESPVRQRLSRLLDLGVRLTKAA
ncbi:MAG: phosphoglucomutase/phosphomannomutase family protein, partial [Candidatus Omnitrophica bacterium]|nr:phosphoglucomutase/phosphomannomutase family protein [Candidatus Omnitrophota bacterium]